MSAASRMPPVAILGAGRAGGGLAALLAARGWPVAAVWSRRPGKARSLVGRIRRSTAGAMAPVSPTAAGRAVAAAPLILMAVPDDALAGLAEELAGGATGLRGRTFLHLSGALPAAVLQPLAESGAGTGSFHPLAVFPARRPPADLLQGALCAVDGPAPVRRLAARLARHLGGRPVTVGPGQRAAYHLAASLVGNDSVALVALALERMQAAGVPEGAARRGLARLLADAARELAAQPPDRALTGPVVRGDARTLARHLEAAGRAETRTVHALLSRVLLRLARRAGRLEPGRARALERLLPPAASGRPPA